METLYIDRRLPSQLSEFAICFIIHAIYKQTREIIDQPATHSLSWHHTPGEPDISSNDKTTTTATSSSAAAAAAVQTQHHPHHRHRQSTLSPYASRWRSSACDCLDILHWSANTKTAQAAGWEQPNVMTLHLSRLLLLTPAAYLRDLPARWRRASESSDGDNNNKNGNDVDINEFYRVLSSWNTADQFEARLSVIHAGSVLWYVRRYCTGLHHEPFAVYLATLVLWAFSISCRLFHGDSSRNGDGGDDSRRGVGGGGGVGETEGERLFFHIDRPCDDEIVQSFIMEGGGDGDDDGKRMSGHLLHVGDISRPEATQLIIREGLRLLRDSGEEEGEGEGEEDVGESEQSSSDVWNTERGFRVSLQGLARFSKFVEGHAGHGEVQG